MSKHTPGPWALEPYATTRSTNGMAYVKAGHRTICEVWYDKKIESDVVCGAEGRANARLIATAPRMLYAGLIPDVLETLAESIEDHAATFGNDTPRGNDLLDIADTLRGHATRQRAILRDVEGE